MTLRQIEDEVARMDPKQKRSSRDFHAAVRLMSAAVVGPDEKKVSRFTGYSMRTINREYQRLRRNGVIKDGKLHIEWFKKKTGGVAFWLDVAVAIGYIRRAQPRP